MKRLVVALLCLGAVSACKKEEPASAPVGTDTAAKAQPSSDALKPYGAKPAGDDDDAPQAGSPDEDKLVVTDELMTRFLGYWDKSITASHAAMKDIGEAAKAADKKGGVMGAAHAMQASNAISERMEAQHDALLKEFNLTESQVGKLQQLCVGIGMQLALAKQTQTDQMIANMKKQAETLSGDQKKEVEKQIAEFEKTFADQRNFKPQRDEFGDQAVDVALKHQDRIVELQQKAYGMLKE